MRRVLHILMFGCLLSTMFVASTTETTEAMGSAAVVDKQCRCGRASCRRCRPRLALRKRCRMCPNCHADVCELKVECVKEKRVCFEVEQRVVCIPKISWPPKRACNCKSCEHPCCDNPCSDDCDCQCRCNAKCGKARTVNILKIKIYECPTCQYKWKLFEPAGCDSGCDGRTDAQDQLPFENVVPAIEEDAEQPGFENNELYDPAGSDVPTPPATTNINN